VGVSKKLVAYHISRLKDRSPEVRLRSIRELAQLGEPEALEALEAVFLNDTVLEVRQAAQEAGRAIYRKQMGNQK
jgi:HEAT repeat protein